MGVVLRTADQYCPSHMALAEVSDRHQPTSKYGPSRHHLAIDETDMGVLYDRYYSGHDEWRNCHNHISIASQLRVNPWIFELSERGLEKYTVSQSKHSGCQEFTRIEGTRGTFTES